MIPGGIATARRDALARIALLGGPVRSGFHTGGAGFDSWALTRKLNDDFPDIRVLHESLRYRSRAGVEYRVPAGFIYDGASIPRPVWPLLPSKDACEEFGALHDWLYRVGPSLGVNRRTADDLGWESLVIQGIGDEWQRDAVWEGLRVGGGIAWRGWRKLGLTAVDPVALITWESA